MCPEASAQLVKSLVGVMQYTAPPQTPTATSLPPGSCEGGAVEGEHGKEDSNCSTTDRQPSSSSDRQLSSSASTSASHSLFESKLVSSCGGGGVAATVEQFSCSSALCYRYVGTSLCARGDCSAPVLHTLRTPASMACKRTRCASDKNVGRTGGG